MSFNTKTHHKLKKKNYPLQIYKLDRKKTTHNFYFFLVLSHIEILSNTQKTPINKLDRMKIEQEKYTLKSEMSF